MNLLDGQTRLSRMVIDGLKATRVKIRIPRSAVKDGDIVQSDRGPHRVIRRNVRP